MTRELAAQALVDWLATDPTGSGDRDYLIIGDLNSYAKEDPIDAIKAGPDDLAGTADDYTNLIESVPGRRGLLVRLRRTVGLPRPRPGQPDARRPGHRRRRVAHQRRRARRRRLRHLVQAAIPGSPLRAERLPVIGPRPGRSSASTCSTTSSAGSRRRSTTRRSLNQVKAGKGVPVKFDLADGLGLDVLFGTPTATQFTCEGGAASDAVEATTSGTSGLQLDPVTGRTPTSGRPRRRGRTSAGRSRSPSTTARIARPCSTSRSSGPRPDPNERVARRAAPLMWPLARVLGDLDVRCATGRRRRSRLPRSAGGHRRRGSTCAVSALLDRLRHRR